MKTLLSILVVAALTSCANPDATVSITAEELKNQPAPAGPALVPVKMKQGIALKSLKLDAYGIMAKLVGDELQVSCSYGGGCKDHVVELVATRYVFDAKTAEVDIIITHDAKNDPCEAMLMSKHRFDLTPIKAAYAESATAGASLPITVKLFDFKGDTPNKVITYSF
jgi:hypothetical protein